MTRKTIEIEDKEYQVEKSEVDLKDFKAVFHFVLGKEKPDFIEIKRAMELDDGDTD